MKIIMTYEQFEKIVLNLKAADENISVLYTIGVDMIEISDHYHKIITDLFKVIFTEEGFDWLEWFMYEKDFGDNVDLKAWDENHNEIVYDIKSLYDLLMESHYNNIK
jgi:hypothetical protein